MVPRCSHSLAVFVASCGLFYACGSPSDKPTACQIVSPAVILAKSPGSLILAIKGVEDGRAVAYFDDATHSTRSAFNVRNGRGKVRLATQSLGAIGVRVAMNGKTVNCSGDLFSAPGYPTAQTYSEIKGVEIRAVAVDVNGDQHLDVLTSTGVVLLGDGKGSFNAVVERFSDQTTDRIGTADFNGDGVLDIVGWNRRGSRSIAKGYVLLSDKGKWNDSSSFKTSFLTGGYGEAAFGDLDADGYADTVTVSQNGLWVHWNEGGTLGAPIRLDPSLGPEVRGFGTGESENIYLSTIQLSDVNADGLPDIIYGRLAMAKGAGKRHFSVEGDLFSFATNCASSLGRQCPRIADFFVLDPGFIFAPFVNGANVVFSGLKPVEAAWANEGTWFGNGDFDGDQKPDVIGFGLLGTPQGVGILSGSGERKSHNPFFAEPSPGNVAAILIDKFDERQSSNQVLLLSGHGQIYLYRQSWPDGE